MVKNLLLASALGVIALPAFGQTSAPPGSGAASNPPATNQQPVNPNMNKPGMNNPGDMGQPDTNNPSTPPGTRPVTPDVSAPGQDFKALDSDGNGSLSEQEYGIIGGPDQPFTAADTDRDGRVSRDEYAKWLKSRPDQSQRSVR